MAHFLVPYEDEPLPTTDVIHRLQKEFKHVVVDKEKGAEFMRKRIANLLHWKKRGTRRRRPIDEQIAEIRRFQDDAYEVLVTDDANDKYAFLRTLVTPEERLFFGYTSREHEEAARPLLKRCAKVLGYEIILQ